MQLLWTEKYFPENWNEFAGNEKAVSAIKNWAFSWKEGKKQKPLLLYGPAGNGKTTLALLCAKIMGWHLFELNASDVRNKDLIEKLAGSAAQGASFSGNRRLILLDEVDGLQRQDRGGAGAIAKILKEAQQPIILTSNELYSKKLSRIKPLCTAIELRRVHSSSLSKLLETICLKENISFEKEALNMLAGNSAGDARAAILDLQSIALSGKITKEEVERLGFRERTENVFSIMASLMRAKSFSEARLARRKSEIDDEMLNAWVSENIPRQFDASDTANAFNFISKADVCEGRIFKRQYYGMRRYSRDLATACAVLSRKKEYHGWVKYQFPSILKELSASMQQRAIRQSICKKIGRKIHESAKSVALNELPLMRLLFSDHETAVNLSDYFGFDEREISFLLGKSKEKKAQKIFEEAENLKKKKVSEKIKLSSREKTEKNIQPQNNGQTKLF